LLSAPPVLPKRFTESTNVRVLGSRERALELTVPKNGKLVEIGTLTGYLRRFMLSKLKPEQLIVMDIEHTAIEKCETQHAEQVRQGCVKCILGDSKKALTELPDDTFDLIYVDGSHQYDGVCGDLEAARTKVKPGGLLVLNDYYMFENIFLANKGRWGVYGVIHAANEFLLRHNWELAYMTLHNRNEPDLAIRRPLHG